MAAEGARLFSSPPLLRSRTLAANNRRIVRFVAMGNPRGSARHGGARHRLDYVRCPGGRVTAWYSPSPSRGSAIEVRENGD
jgi:hypothetical protein